MNKEFNKGLLLAGFGSFWWGFFGVIYFKYIAYIGHIELVIHRCLWTAFTLILTTFFFSKWNIFFKIIKNKSNLFYLLISGFLIFIMVLKLTLNLKIIKSTYYIKILTINKNDGGETGIRTQERVAPLPVFKTGAFNRSAISP